MPGIKCAEPPLHAHARQRIFELGPAVATHPISSTLDCENAAQMAMAATKDKIKDGYQSLHTRSVFRRAILRLLRWFFCGEGEATRIPKLRPLFVPIPATLPSHIPDFLTMPAENTSRDAVFFCYHGRLVDTYHVRGSWAVSRLARSCRQDPRRYCPFPRTVITRDSLGQRTEAPVSEFCPTTIVVFLHETSGVLQKYSIS